MQTTLKIEGTLTADVDRFTERSCDLWVKVDHEVAFLCNLFIAILDLLRDPLSEVVTSKRVDHVDDPLTRKLGHVALFRKVMLDLLDSASVREDGVDSESLVHGNMQVLRILRFYNYRNVGEVAGYLLFFSPRTISLRK